MAQIVTFLVGLGEGCGWGFGMWACGFVGVDSGMFVDVMCSPQMCGNVWMGVRYVGFWGLGQIVSWWGVRMGVCVTNL